MKLNPNAVALWLFAAGLGFLVSGFDWKGAVVGATIGLGISVVVGFLPSGRR